MKLQIDKLGKVAITVEKDYWDISKDYDKLVVVQKENINTSYLSRKPVPAGTELTDREYWIPFSRCFEITQEFGNNPDIAISQKAITDELNKANSINKYIFDISAYNAINGVPKRYNTFSEAIQDVPIELRVPGLNMAYFDFNIYKYKQYRLETSVWSTSEDNWLEIGLPDTITSPEMDEVLVQGVPNYLTDSTGASVLDNSGNPIEII